MPELLAPRYIQIRIGQHIIFLNICSYIVWQTGFQDYPPRLHVTSVLGPRDVCENEDTITTAAYTVSDERFRLNITVWNITAKRQAGEFGAKTGCNTGIEYIRSTREMTEMSTGYFLRHNGLKDCESAILRLATISVIAVISHKSL